MLALRLPPEIESRLGPGQAHRAKQELLRPRGHPSGPILTLGSQASGESAHQTNASGENLAEPSVRFYPLERIGDLEDVYVAEQRLADLRAGHSDTVPLDELMKRHGLDD